MGRLTHQTGEGWTYFVTTKAWQSVAVFQVKEIADVVVKKLLEYRDGGNYLLHGFVLMPNHLHLILTPSSARLEKCMQLIKAGSSFEIHKLRGSRTEIWQSGFHESRVKNWEDYQIKRDYVVFNPVAAKLAERPEDWPFSSASGKYALDPIPQGLKPHSLQSSDVGPKGPTPKPAEPAVSLKDQSASGTKAPLAPTTAPELKPVLAHPADVGAEAPTPDAVTGKQR